MRTRIKVVITDKTPHHVHCSVFEGEDRGDGGAFTYAKNGDLVFGREAFLGFYHALERGQSGGTIVHLEDQHAARTAPTGTL